MPDEPRDPPRLLTVHDVAQHWACSPRQVYTMIERGELPAIAFGPKLIRIRIEDVETVEAKLLSTKKAAPPKVGVPYTGGRDARMLALRNQRHVDQPKR